MGTLVFIDADEMLSLIQLLRDELTELYKQIEKKDKYDSNENRIESIRDDKNKTVV